MDWENEEKLKKENKMMRIALACLSGLLLVALAVVLFFVVYNGVNPTQSPATEPPTVAGTSDYTKADEQAVAAAGQVVAHVGDKQLTNAELQAYYCMTVYDFLNNNGSYLAYYGLDITKPLGEQVYDPTTGQTWEDLFLEQALNTWNRYAVLQTMAENEGYTMREETSAELDGILTQMESVATSMEYADAAEMIASEMGASCTVEGYMSYMRTNFFCGDYFNNLYKKLEPTMAEIEAYYNENEATFVSSGAGKEKGTAIDVRHILLIPEGGEAIEGSNYKNYTEEAWEKCRIQAQEVLDAYLAGDRSESSFATLAAQHSADGSASSGGLITNILEGNTVENFNNWIFDQTRAYGDYALIQTEFGYHVMFFVEAEPLWIRTARTTMVGNEATELIDKAVEENPMEVNMDLIKLSNIKF